MGSLRESYTCEPVSLEQLPSGRCCLHVIQIEATCRVPSLGTLSLFDGGRHSREAEYSGVVWHDHQTEDGKLRVLVEVYELKDDGRH